MQLQLWEEKRARFSNHWQELLLILLWLGLHQELWLLVHNSDVAFLWLYREHHAGDREGFSLEVRGVALGHDIVPVPFSKYFLFCVRYDAQEGEPRGVRGDFTRAHIWRLASAIQSYDEDDRAKNRVYRELPLECGKQTALDTKFLVLQIGEILITDLLEGIRACHDFKSQILI